MIPVHDFFVEKYGIFMCHVAPEALPLKLAENLEPDQLYAILQFDMSGGVYRLTCAAWEEWELDDHFQVHLSQVTPISSHLAEKNEEEIHLIADQMDDMDDIDIDDLEDFWPIVEPVPVREMPNYEELERIVHRSVDHELRWEKEWDSNIHSQMEYFG